MSEVQEPEFFIWQLFDRLRRQRFPLGMDDYAELRRALRAGFGLASRRRLCDLCCALWAKSAAEQEVVRALFEQIAPADWDILVLATPDLPADPAPAARAPDPPTPAVPEPMPTPPATTPLIERQESLPAIPDGPGTYDGGPFIFIPQFPLTYREIAQTWRRLRRPVRSGPSIELDIEATVAGRSRTGLLSLMLVPRRRNTTRLLLLVDRRGSMQPFHRFVDHVCAAIRGAANLGQVATFFFHDVPAKGADRTPLDALPGQMAPQLDTVLPQIAPLERGSVYADPHLLEPQPIANVLDSYADGAAVVIIGDAGAARGRHDALRLLNTIAFLKALHRHTTRYVWLNPLPQPYWVRGACAQIRRHVAMFPLDRTGMEQAVNVLHGRPHEIEKPL